MRTGGWRRRLCLFGFALVLFGFCFFFILHELSKQAIKERYGMIQNGMNLEQVEEIMGRKYNEGAMVATLYPSGGSMTLTWVFDNYAVRVDFQGSSPNSQVQGKQWIDGYVNSRPNLIQQIWKNLGL